VHGGPAGDESIDFRARLGYTGSEQKKKKAGRKGRKEARMK
jgi:hypothetical protein